MSGMGQTGPYKDHVAYGQTVQALGGLTYMTSMASGRPTGLEFAYADPISGLYGIIAILTALANRDRTGRGCHIDLSEYEAICNATGPELISAQRHNAESASAVVDLLRKAGVPARPFSKSEDLMKDPQLHHRKFFRPLPSSNNEIQMTDANPIQMDDTFKEPWQPSPELGQDNRHVFLGLLGISESQYDLYREKSIIA